MQCQKLIQEKRGINFGLSKNTSLFIEKNVYNANNNLLYFAITNEIILDLLKDRKLIVLNPNSIK